METGYKVSEIMIREVQTATPTDKIIDCAKRMADKKVGCLIIKNEGNVVGIITEQDLARKAMAKGINAYETAVSEIMEKNVLKIRPHRDLNQAITLMGNNEIKHLPVVHEGKLKGIIASKDILQIEPSLIELLILKNTKEQKTDQNSTDEKKEDFYDELEKMQD